MRGAYPDSGTHPSKLSYLRQMGIEHGARRRGFGALIGVSGPMTNTERTVWLPAGVRFAGSPEALAGSMP